MITSYNRQINLSVRDIANSMKDSSTLTSMDDSTMAMVKMLRNWYSSMDSCGEFRGVKSYTADMTDQVLTMKLDADYAQAEVNDSKIDVTFTYDLARNVTLLSWEVKDSFSASVGKAGMNTLIGLGTVFIVLLFLTFIISQIHWIPDILNRKKKTSEAPAPAPAPAPAAAPVAEEIEETDDLELIAVISAAIAASEQAPADGFVVRSIRRRGR
ncbi:MAG: OadG family protein, partial [Lachnospiraceae bacterium]|nr:OadG family protein [Lachnospiraceae bacterium]